MHHLQQLNVIQMQCDYISKLKYLLVSLDVSCFNHIIERRNVMEKVVLFFKHRNANAKYGKLSHVAKKK